jgi:hypothetical protein
MRASDECDEQKAQPLVPPRAFAVKGEETLQRGSRLGKGTLEKGKDGALDKVHRETLPYLELVAPAEDIAIAAASVVAANTARPMPRCWACPSTKSLRRLASTSLAPDVEKLWYIDAPNAAAAAPPTIPSTINLPKLVHEAPPMMEVPLERDTSAIPLLTGTCERGGIRRIRGSRTSCSRVPSLQPAQAEVGLLSAITRSNADMITPTIKGGNAQNSLFSSALPLSHSRPQTRFSVGLLLCIFLSAGHGRTAISIPAAAPLRGPLLDEDMLSFSLADRLAHRTVWPCCRPLLQARSTVAEADGHQRSQNGRRIHVVGNQGMELGICERRSP